MSDNLVPEPQSTIFDAVNAVVGNEDEAQAIIANPSLAKDILGNDDASAVKSECCGAMASSRKTMNAHADRMASSLKVSMRSAVPLRRM